MIVKNILLVITDFGSFNNFLSELSVHLNNGKIIKISVVCSSTKVINIEDKFDYTQYDINFHFIDIPRSFNFIKQLKASKLINNLIDKEKPDIIHAHFTTAIFTTLILKKRNAIIWGTFHGLGFPVSTGYKKLIFMLIEYYSFYKLTKIIVLNKVDYKSIPKIFKHKLVKHKCLGLGTNLNTFSKNKFGENERNVLKNKFNIENHFVLAYTGRYVSFKGFDIMAKTFIKLTDEYKNRFKLILIGGRDSIHTTGLSKNEEDLFFSNSDLIEIGFTKHVNHYLSIVDLFIFPSKKEGVPISITEALAMEIPVITFNSRGCNDLVKDGINGIVISEKLNKAESIETFFKATCDLYSDKKLYNKLRQNILENRDSFSRENFINEQAELYKEYFKG